MDRELIERLAKECLRYEPETGAVIWRVSRGTARAGAVAGCRKQDGYWHLRIGGKLLFAHRIAWLLHYGVWPSGQLDHVNGNKADNRMGNLRDCTPVQNQWNAKPRANRSGHKGVSQHYGGWQARIRVNRRIVHLGTYATAEDASSAYQAAARKFAGEYAWTPNS